MLAISRHPLRFLETPRFRFSSISPFVFLPLRVRQNCFQRLRICSRRRCAVTAETREGTSRLRHRLDDDRSAVSLQSRPGVKAWSVVAMVEMVLLTGPS